MPMKNELVLPPLPYESDGLCPAFSAASVELHREIVQTHADALRILSDGMPPRLAKTPEAILCCRHRIGRDDALLRWHAGALYAHTLYFSSMKPYTGGYPCPGERLRRELMRDVGSYAELGYRLKEAAVGMLGAGFVYLVRTRAGTLAVRAYREYDTPIPYGEIPLLCVDLWEHAYLSDHGVSRERAVDAFLSVTDWGRAEARAY